MKYILIIFAYFSHGPIITTAEFNDKLTCEVAATAVQVRINGAKAFCVPKGNED